MTHRTRWAHVTNAMKDAAAARVVISGMTRCPKCGMWIRDEEIKDGVFPVHYLIGKIPCGWKEADEMTAPTIPAPLLSTLAALAQADAEYPRDLLAARRAGFVEKIQNANSEQQLAAIDQMLGETTDLEIVNDLLEQKAEILISLGDA